ncbi:MAG: hypothetical protein HQL29_00500 [Candidatus Omnitrophica bacterium]|nr:hypothetical protein [Candidatus Omnitrophota bacterium]
MKLRKRTLLFALPIVMIITFTANCITFDSKFADATIDWFAFLAGIYLIIEGITILFSGTNLTPAGITRISFRIIIGVCVFTIHLLQFFRK